MSHPNAASACCVWLAFEALPGCPPPAADLPALASLETLALAAARALGGVLRQGRATSWAQKGRRQFVVPWLKQWLPIFGGKSRR